MYWNNRIFKHVGPTGVVTYAIHECYYNKDNKIDGYTESPVLPPGNTVDELIEHLEQLLNDAKRSKNDVLKYDEDSFN